MIGTLKNSFLTFLLIFSFCFSSFAENCDWTQIKKNADGTYTYTEQLHVCVGQTVQDDAVKTQQVTDLNKAVSLKDLTIKASDDRANLWMDTSSKLEARVQKLDSMEKHSEWLYFGIGVVTTFLAGVAAAKLVNK